jgi:hypothetical protein
MERKNFKIIIILGMLVVLVLFGVVRAVIHEIKAPISTPPNLFSAGMGG